MILVLVIYDFYCTKSGKNGKKTRVTSAAGFTAGAHKINAKSRRPIKRDSSGAPQALTQTQISTLLKFPKVSSVPSNAQIK